MNRLIGRHVSMSLNRTNNVICQNAVRTVTNAPLNNTPTPMPRLMNFPEIIWPSLYKTVRNWILATCVIRPYLDKEFYIKDFMEGAKHAIQVVSCKIAKGENAESFQGLVTDNAIEELQNSIRTLSLTQRHQIEIKKDDIFFIFPYEIGIIFGEENEKPPKRWVEITTVCHALNGFYDMQQRGETISFSFGSMSEYQDQIYVANYRFIKEFTKGVQSSWAINIVNHFKPIDIVKENQSHH